MEHYRPAPGTPLKDLDTPCLLIDLDAVEHNFRLIADTYQDTVCKMRTHVKNLKSPILAHMQIRAGGTVGGVCAAKVAEAGVAAIRRKSAKVSTQTLQPGVILLLPWSCVPNSSSSKPIWCCSRWVTCIPCTRACSTSSG